MCGCVLCPYPFLSLSLSLSLVSPLSLCVRFSKLSSWPARQWSSSLAHCLLPYAMSCLPACLPGELSLVRLVRLWSGGQLTLSYICMFCCQQQRRLQLPAIECGPGDQRPTTTTTTQMFSFPLPLVIPLTLPLPPLSALPSWLVCPFPASAPGSTFCLWQNNSICWLLCLSI